MSNLQTVQSIYEAFGKGDIPAIIAAQSDDVEWERGGTDHGVPWLKPGRGKAHVGSFFQALSAIEISKFDVQPARRRQPGLRRHRHRDHGNRNGRQDQR
jgi:ketosteroid isomerase-like protein